MDMDRLFQDVKAHLQDLDHSQRMTLAELDTVRNNVDTLRNGVDTLRNDVDTVRNDVDRLSKDVGLLRKSVTLGHAATTALGGTFAGIEQILKSHEQRISALDKQDPAA